VIKNNRFLQIDLVSEDALSSKSALCYDDLKGYNINRNFEAKHFVISQFYVKINAVSIKSGAFKMQEILIGGHDGAQVIMDAAMGNRHGMISGATGTGKTITLQILAEGFSKIGVPVFLADIKGDL